jgi:uncharacterized protein with HEPN domain
LSREDFETNDLVRDAVLRNLEIMGEAAKNIPASIRELDAGIPWRQICGFRDHLVHAYFGVDDDIIWNVIEGRLPGLLTDVAHLLDKVSNIP